MSRICARLLWIGLAANALGVTGCFTLAKQAYHEAVGAQGDVICITEPKPVLSEYQGLEFKPATTTVNSRLCPPDLLRAYDRCVNRCLARLQSQYPGGEPKLVGESEILYFQKKGLLSGALMLTRVRLRAADELKLDVLVRAESEAFRAGGEEDLSQASAEALRKFFERQKQVTTRERRQAESRPARGTTRGE